MEKTVIIAGPGVMGASIAQIFAKYQYQVTLYGRRNTSLEKGKSLIAINQKASVKNGESTPEESSALLSRISYTTEKACFQQALFVIESITENIEEKRRFFQEISTIVPSNTILTTNTSGLSITEIAKAVTYPERFCGMHWVNPPHLVPLVEVIQGEKTSEQTAAFVYQAALSVHKKPIRVKKEGPGFLLNRFQFAILREAMHIVENGYAGKEEIDAVFKYGLGMRYACLGPFEIADLGGLDTFYNIASYLFPDLCNNQEVSPMLMQLISKGHYGVKSGSGFYDYGGGKDKEAIANRDTAFMKLFHCLYD